MSLRNSPVAGYVFITCVVATLLALGVWQLQRLEEKEALIARYEASKLAVPVGLGDVPTAEALKEEYRRVSLEGQLDFGKELFLGGRSVGRDTGYDLLTPLTLPDGRVVLLDRGWIRMDHKDARTRPGTQALPVAQGLAMVRFAKKPGMMTPANHPEKNFWFTVDMPAMRKATGLPLEDFYLEAIDPAAKAGDEPYPGNGKVEIRNDHLGYAFTWFALALAAGVIFVVYRRQNKPVSEAAA